MQEKLLPLMEFLQMQEKVVCLRKCFCKCRKKLCAFDRIFANARKSYVPSIELPYCLCRTAIAD